MNCRFCGTKLKHIFIDLINSPLSNSFLNKSDLLEPEVYYPLNIFVCHKCFLVQIEEYKKSNEIFNDTYHYYSSYSESWLKHSEKYVEEISNLLDLNSNSLVVEIASNDGYLLQYFLKKKIPCIGIEPAANVALKAKEKGIKVIVDYFGYNLAEKLLKESIHADLIVGNNVLAHVPDIRDFVKSLKMILKPLGTITIEFPHLLNLLRFNQFDTIYHEHFSYLSLFTVVKIFKEFGLDIYDVAEIETHGGSLRIYAKHIDNNSLIVTNRVDNVLKKEANSNLNNLSAYKGFQQEANKIKIEFMNFLVKSKIDNKKIVAYGAAAKGNTLLNFIGVKNDFISFVVDRSPYKQNKYLPGSHIPIVNENRIVDFKPDYVIILPWNLTDEIVNQLDYIRDWGAKFVVAIPKLRIF